MGIDELVVGPDGPARRQRPPPPHIQGVLPGRKAAIAFPRFIGLFKLSIVDELQGPDETANFVEIPSILGKPVVDIGIIIHKAQAELVVYLRVDQRGVGQGEHDILIIDGQEVAAHSSDTCRIGQLQELIDSIPPDLGRRGEGEGEYQCYEK